MNTDHLQQNPALLIAKSATTQQSVFPRSHALRGNAYEALPITHRIKRTHFHLTPSVIAKWLRRRGNLLLATTGQLNRLHPTCHSQLDWESP